MRPQEPAPRTGEPVQWPKKNGEYFRVLSISALKGDNEVSKSANIPWYGGPTLMFMPETVHIGSDLNLVDCRFPVQCVIRLQTNEHHDYRAYGGRIACGVFKPGDQVMVLPSGFTSRISGIDTPIGPVSETFAPMSVSIRLENELDISRGDMLVRANNVPTVSQDIELMICYMTPAKLQTNGKYFIRHTTREARCVIKEILYKVEISTLHHIQDDKAIGMNDIARILLRTTKPFLFDKYQINRNTGSVILIDEGTNKQ